MAYRRDRPRQSSFQSDQMIKIVAKIRSLQDDLHAVKLQNQSIKIENARYLETISLLESDIDLLTQKYDQLERDLLLNQTDRDLEYYETELTTLHEHITALNHLLQQRNEENQHIQENRNKLLNEQSNLKERLNQLQLRQNQQNQKLIQVLQCTGEDSCFEMSTVKQVEFIGQFIDELETKTKQTQSEQWRKNIEKQILQEKQRRIKLQYQYRLMTERKRDNFKQTDFWEKCLNRDHVEAVVEDMLTKEDQLLLRLEQAKQSELQQDEETEVEIFQLRRENRMQIQQNELARKEMLKEECSLMEQLNEVRVFSRQIEDKFISLGEPTECDGQSEGVLGRSASLQEENKVLQVAVQTAESQLVLLKEELRMLSAE